MHVSIHHTAIDTHVWQTRRYDLVEPDGESVTYALEIQRGEKMYDETIAFYFRDLADLEQFAASINAQVEDAQRMTSRLADEHAELAPVAPQKKGR